MSGSIKQLCLILISIVSVSTMARAQSNTNNPYCPHPLPCWEPYDDPSMWHGNNCCYPKAGFTAIPGEPCKHCDGRGGVMDKLDGYKPPNTHCKECISGALVDIVSTCRGASGWMPTRYAMQCGTCGPYALQARDLGRCDPVADCGCRETTHDFMRRVRLQCNNEWSGTWEVALQLMGCSAAVGKVCGKLPAPPAQIACAIHLAPACACAVLNNLCQGCKVVSFQVVQQREGCL